MSHSRALAEAAVALAGEMLQGQDVVVEVAAGLDDGAVGTDAAAIMEALSAADRGDGVVVLMDLGSAVLSAELALEMLDDEARARVLLCPAPLVEGLVAACVAAAGGAARDAVAAEAMAGLAGKQSHLQVEAPAVVAPSDPAVESASVVVTNAHGLHARPAARLVQQALSTDAAVEVRNATTGSAWVPATSLSQVATLGARQGHALELRASGPRAREALAALVELAERAFDEPPRDAVPAQEAPLQPAPPAPAAPAAAGVGRPLGASPGVAVGRAHRLDGSSPGGPYEPAGDPEQEWTRLAAARAQCREALRTTRARAVATVGETEAAVFDAHLLLLDDADLLDDARRRVTAGETAPEAWAAAVQRVEAAFAGLPDPYLQARTADVVAVGDQVLGALVGTGDDAAGTAAGTAAGIVIAPDLTPAQAVALEPERVAGVVLAHGSPTSHSAILVRALGIPAVVGAGHDALDIPEGTLVGLDGGTGELVVDPDQRTLDRLRDRAAALSAAAELAARRSAEPARTRDGVEVHLGANIGSLTDAVLAADNGADLAGLVRTEFLFAGEHAPAVEEQEQVYRRLAEALGGRRLTLRTLDVGGDKPLPYLPVAVEANPFLGLRGLRLSLAAPGLLADQLLAIVRVARDTPVSVMFPMVTTVDELLAARAELDAALARDGRGRPAGLRVGMMVEVPAAALKTAAFASHVDFFSIGTNDLTQYALAAERGSTTVSALADPYDPGVLQLIAAVCAGAGDAGVAVCGELAADEGAAALLVGLGVRELSVGPRAVPAVKQAVRGIDTRAATRTAAAALRAGGAAAVRALLEAGSEDDLPPPDDARQHDRPARQPPA